MIVVVVVMVSRFLSPKSTLGAVRGKLHPQIPVNPVGGNTAGDWGRVAAISTVFSEKEGFWKK
jgi:hypothetical protein